MKKRDFSIHSYSRLRMKTFNLFLVAIVLFMFGSCTPDNILTENLSTTTQNHSKKKSSNTPTSDNAMSVMPDVAGNWAETEINYMVSNGYMSGFPDGTFKPNNKMSRAQFASMIVGCLNPSPRPEHANLNFSDISGHWAESNILQAARAGFLSGYPDGTFMPNQNINKLQATISLSNGFNVSGGNTNNLATFFTDHAGIVTWARQDVANALANKLVVNYSNKMEFSSTEEITRAEATAIMYCALKRINSSLTYTNSYVVNPNVTPVPTGDFSLNYQNPVYTGTPIVFSGTTSNVTSLKFFLDGYPLGTATPSNGSYSFTATVNTAGIARVLRVEGYYGSILVKARNQTIDVRSSTPVSTSPIIQGVPYYFQLNNTLYPYQSCQNTSIAMVLGYYGAGTSPDNITGRHGKNAAQTVPGLQSVFNYEAQRAGLSVRITGTQSGTLSQMEALLDQGKPVIAHGYTTSFGHVLVFIGYDANYYYAHDPYGVWDGVAYSSGYSGGSTSGKAIRYSKSSVRSAFSPDGWLWMHRVN